MTDTEVYAEIIKFEKKDDGTLSVVGRATGPDLDHDRQICDPTWLSEAMPKWFSTGGNIREQHSKVAAGVATELAKTDDDGWMVTADVVDPVSVLKVERQVLKGFSIGIKDARVVKDGVAAGGRIVGGRIVETSLVDRPCNPTCKLTITKAAKPGQDVQALDPEKMLVKVEELWEAEPPPEVDSIIKEFTSLALKTSPAEDIASAQDAICQIARIIVSEAMDLSYSGNTAELDDINALTMAAEGLRYFMSRESRESDMADEDKGAEVTPETSEETPKADETSDLEKMITEAIAKAREDDSNRIAELEKTVATVKAQPQPGGPVLTRTAAQTDKADREEAKNTQIAYYKRLASQVSDPSLMNAYMDEARKLEMS